MTLLLGIRRSGKSPIVKVLMNEEKRGNKDIWLYLDLRKFESSFLKLQGFNTRNGKSNKTLPCLID